MRYPQILALAGLALSVASHVWALNPKLQLTQYVHRIWQTQQGLPQTTIYEITQTRDGYIWVGAQNGAVRFDGIRFTSVPQLEAAGLSDMWVRQIVEDQAGNVWISTGDYSLIRTTRKNATAFHNHQYACVMPLHDGTVVACTEDGIARLGAGEPQLIHANSKFPETLTAGCESPDGTLWMVGGATVASFDGSNFQEHHIKSVPADAIFRSVLCSGDSVWIGSGKGLIRLRGRDEKSHEEKLFTTRDGLPDNIVLSLAPGANGVMWVGTRDGYSRYSQGVFENFGYREGLSQNTVFAVLEDREGSLWVGTGHGLNQFADGVATRFTKREGLPSENMGPVIEGLDGKLWAGAQDGGLASYDGRRFKPVPGTGNAQVIALASTPDGDLWAGTKTGLLRFRNGIVKASYGMAHGLPADFVRSLYVDKEGTLWAGTVKGPAFLRGDRFVQQPSLIGMDVPVVTMGQTAKNEMLFGLERGGLWILSNGKLRRINDARPLPFMDINSVFTDPEGITWIGTNGSGLGMLRDGVLRRLSNQDGLPDSEVYGFMMDDKDRIWMAGSKGFFWSKRSDLINFVSGKGAKIKTVPYLPQEGLRVVQGTSGIQPVGSRTRDGRLWFSTTQGLVAFEPDTGVRQAAPPVTLEQVTVNGASSFAEANKVFGPGRVNLAISYTALTFLSPQRLQFRYMLEGYDRDWVEAGSRREAFYTNLPPGDFKFRVAACSANATCAEAASALGFEIASAFYQRAWFLPMLALILSGIAWLVYQMRVRQLRSQFALVLGERSRIARELHDTLIQGFSGITMQLQALTARLSNDDHRATLREIIQEAGTCLQETRRSVAGLRAGAGASSGLSEAIETAARTITDHQDVRLKLDLEDAHCELPAEVKYNLVCIAQEAVTNALKHAAAKNISVGLRLVNKELVLSIADDGRGMSVQPRAEGHYGMVGMRERAAQMGAHLSIDSAPGKGATVTVHLPVTKETRASSAQPRLKTAS